MNMASMRIVLRARVRARVRVRVRGSIRVLVEESGSITAEK